MVSLLFTEKAKKACLREPLQDREREEREGSVIGVAESMSRKSRRNSIRSRSLQIHREFYSDERDIQWTDQAQRERIPMCCEVEMRSRLHQEYYARSCQEIEELKRRCFQEENGVTQQKMNEQCLQHDQESRTVSLLRDQVRRLQERVEFLKDSKIFPDPDSPSSFGSAHVSHQAFIPSSSKKPNLESKMQQMHERT